MRFFKCSVICLLLSLKVAGADAELHPLFNGRDLTGWETFLTSLDPGETQPDPLKEFTVATADGRPAIHISGEGLGVLMTSESFTNFHLRAQFKWGEKRWGSKADLPRDTGILFYCQGEAGSVARAWPHCVEFQVKEHETGDLYALGTEATATASPTGTNQFIYNPKGESTVFAWKRKPLTNRCIKQVDAEKPLGEWNSLDLVCSEGNATFTVNGRVTMRIADARNQDGTNAVPLLGGRIALQTEGAEVFFRDLKIREIK